MLRLVKLYAFGVLVLIALPVQAVITSVTTTPTQINVPIDRPTTLTVVWNVTESGAPGAPITISSASGEFRDSEFGNLLLGTVNKTISTVFAPAGRTEVVRISETLVIPAALIQRARSLGLGSFVYVRTFSPFATDTTGSITFRISSGAAGGFGINRLALTFDDGSAVRVVPVKTPLHVQAQVSYTGSGLLQGTWEVAGPGSTAGEPVFRPLRTLRQHLIAGDSQTLAGPDLPTDVSGFYLARLRLTDPLPGFEPPTLRYFVGEAGIGGIPPRPFALSTPPDGALLAGDTRFAWQGVDGARAYRLEIYAGPDDPAPDLPSLGSESVDPRPTAANLREPPVTGMLVPAKQTQTALTVAARQRLEPGRSYLWRVRAVGRDGVIIGESPVREMRTP